MYTYVAIYLAWLSQLVNTTTISMGYGQDGGPDLYTDLYADLY